MIVTNIEQLRDPFVLVDNGIYYIYGTGVNGEDWDNTKWVCYKNISGRLDGEWKKVEKEIAVLPDGAIKNRWAPEVYKYNGVYYMFATYYSSKTQHRGCSIFKSDSAEGPFIEISDGHITPKDWDAIDGTLYIDGAGQLWMIFVYEWTSTQDNVGRMVAAKLSDDMTHFISEPVELFRADAPLWAVRNITDGCFMYTTKTGQLLMIWSNYNKDGYCVGIARSKDGKIEGEWEQDERLLFSIDVDKMYDGGHGMLFNDADGKMYLAIHSPNNEPIHKRNERTLLIRVRENADSLIVEE